MDEIPQSTPERQKLIPDLDMSLGTAALGGVIPLPSRMEPFRSHKSPDFRVGGGPSGDAAGSDAVVGDKGLPMNPGPDTGKFTNFVARSNRREHDSL